MISTPDPAIQMPEWMKSVALFYVTKPFKVEWMSTMPLPLHEVEHLRNPYNSLQGSMLFCKDGQEYSPSCGRHLTSLLREAGQTSQRVTPPRTRNLECNWRRPDSLALRLPGAPEVPTSPPEATLSRVSSTSENLIDL